MPFIMPEGTRVPSGTDNYDLTTDLRKMAESQSTIVPIANTTMRTSMVNAMIAAGRTPTTMRPLWVDRVDLGAWYALESTTDGSTWKLVLGETNDPFDTPSGYIPFETTARCIRQGNVVTMAGGMQKSSATTSLAANTPMQIGSPRVGYRPWSNRRIGYAATSLGPGLIRYDATAAQLTVEYATAQTISTLSYWVAFNGLTWTMDI